MSLEKDDIETLENWFCELQSYNNGTESYFVLRDKIYGFIYGKLGDLLLTKKYEWHRKYLLTEDDVHSIFHDVLLSCVENYIPKRVKFVTYFWLSCDNQAKNYYKKYRRQRRIPMDKLLSVDFGCFTEAKTDPQGNSYGVHPDIYNQLKTMYDSDITQQDTLQQLTESMALLHKGLNQNDRDILAMMEAGKSLDTISKILNLDDKQVKKSARTIRRKAKDILQIS